MLLRFVFYYGEVGSCMERKANNYTGGGLACFPHAQQGELNDHANKRCLPRRCYPSALPIFHSPVFGSDRQFHSD